jgi:CRP-like cAMP-binding protein
MTKTCEEGKVNPLCFHTLSFEEWQEISREQHLVQFSRNEFISRQGSPTASVVFILSGLVRHFIEGETGRAFNISILRSGQFIGLPCIFDQPIFNSSCVALSSVQACHIGIDVIKSLVERNNAFALRLIRRHMEDENHFMETVKRLHNRQMPGKLAQTLLYLNTLSFEEQPVFALLSRQDISDFAGISPINVIKLLKQFEAEALIQLKGKQIHVVNEKALMGIAAKG